MPRECVDIASTNPSWAAYNMSLGIYNNNNVYTRTSGFYLYASRSSNYDFIDYGIYSTDAAVRNRSYVGIAAELLGGSDLIKHLKGNFAGTVSASFPGNKFGGAIVVKASRVGTDSTIPADRYFPGTGTPSSFIYYRPGDGGNSTPYTRHNFGLPPTSINDGDVVPLSNFGYEFDTGFYNPNKSNMDWPSNIPWPPADPNISNSFYGYP